MHSNPETFKVAIQIIRNRAKGINHHRNHFCLRVPHSSNFYSQFRVVIDLFKFPPCTTMLYQKLPGIPAHLLKFYLGPTNNDLAKSHHSIANVFIAMIKLRQLSLDFKSNLSLLMYESFTTSFIFPLLLLLLLTFIKATGRENIKMFAWWN